jgi:hypothetical protein
VKFHEGSIQAELLPECWMPGVRLKSAACHALAHEAMPGYGDVHPCVLHLLCDQSCSLVSGNKKILIYHFLATKMFHYQIFKKLSNLCQWGRNAQNSFAKKWIQLVKRSLYWGIEALSWVGYRLLD